MMSVSQVELIYCKYLKGVRTDIMRVTPPCWYCNGGGLAT